MYLNITLLRSNQPSITTAQPMAWVWGGATRLSDQWQAGRVLRGNLFENSHFFIYIPYGETEITLQL